MEKNIGQGRGPGDQSQDLMSSLGFTGRTVLNVGEVAASLRITIQHVIDLIDEGQLTAINIGGDGRRHYRIPTEALRAFLENRRSV
jgi:excisionase family DNA binding protein